MYSGYPIVKRKTPEIRLVVMGGAILAVEEPCPGANAAFASSAEIMILA
jgi:hypothetical protein